MKRGEQYIPNPMRCYNIANSMPTMSIIAEGKKCAGYVVNEIVTIT